MRKQPICKSMPRHGLVSDQRLHLRTLAEADRPVCKRVLCGRLGPLEPTRAFASVGQDRPVPPVSRRDRGPLPLVLLRVLVLRYQEGVVRGDESCTQRLGVLAARRRGRHKEEVPVEGSGQKRGGSGRLQRERRLGGRCPGDGTGVKGREAEGERGITL